MRTLTTLVAAVLLCSACSAATSPSTTATAVGKEASPTTTSADESVSTMATPVEMEVSSRAFVDRGVIPKKHTCDGEDIAPDLDITGIPPTAVSLALIVDDPDAPVGVWDHLVLYGIEVQGSELTIPEGNATVGVFGVNSWNLPEYGGPCPPQGETHRYFFTVYALDIPLLIPGGVDSAGVRIAMEGHVLAEGLTMATYRR